MRVGDIRMREPEVRVTARDGLAAPTYGAAGNVKACVLACGEIAAQWNRQPADSASDVEESLVRLESSESRCNVGKMLANRMKVVPTYRLDERPWGRERWSSPGHRIERIHTHEPREPDLAPGGLKEGGKHEAECTLRRARHYWNSVDRTSSLACFHETVAVSKPVVGLRA